MAQHYEYTYDRNALERVATAGAESMLSFLLENKAISKKDYDATHNHFHVVILSNRTVVDRVREFLGWPKWKESDTLEVCRYTVLPLEKCGQ